MDSLFRRFVFFGIGLLAGLFLVSFLFNDQISSCSYFPNERVIDEAGNKPWEIGRVFEIEMAVNQIDSTKLRTLFQEGEIDFDLSKPRKKPCGDYYMKLKNGLNYYTLQFDKCEDHVVMKSLNPID